VRFAFIRAEDERNGGRPRADRLPVSFMCAVLEVSRSGYYAWRKRPPPARAVADAELTAEVIRIHREHKGRYGIDRIHKELARAGRRHSPRRVRRLARAAGLSCVHPRPYKVTTRQARKRQAGLVDLAGRQFVPAGKNQLWYGDITYLKTMTGWAYMATVIDGYSNKVIGWSVADHMRQELVSGALQMAIAARRPARGHVVFHSDRGAQYTSTAFRDLCLGNGILPSVGKTGTCYDNAAAESWHATLKKELIHLRPWAGLKAVRKAVFHYVEAYYNRRRIQKRLGYLSPAEYEAQIDLSVSSMA
jgi:putative transposase